MLRKDTHCRPQPNLWKHNLKIMDLKFILESILFSAQKPLSPSELRDLLKTAAEAVGSGDAAG